jgi:hypothetical protein
VVLVGHNPASEIYVRGKVKSCEEVGIYSEKITPVDAITTEELLELIENESMASSVSQFEILFVPAILQTKEYASAILRCVCENVGAERVASFVDLRMRRRELLDGGPKFAFILDESILHRLVGSPSIMSQQLMYLIKLSKLPNVTIQVVPYRNGLYPWTKGTFEVVHYEDAPDEDIVFIEDPCGDVISCGRFGINNYQEAFERIRRISLEPSDSVDRLFRAAGKMI